MKLSRAIPDLARQLSWFLAVQTILGLGLVCAVVYLVTALTLANRQQHSLDDKQNAIELLLRESSSSHNLESLHEILREFLTNHNDTSLRIADQGQSGMVFFQWMRDSANDSHVISREFPVKFKLIDEPPRTMQALLVLDRRQDDFLLLRLAWTLVLASLVGTLLVSLTGVWLVRKGLSPLRLLVEQTKQVSAQNLQIRLDGSNQPQELKPLISQFNALLDHLSAAYQQMEAFNADVAHELNTPLTTLISSCELALRKPRTAQELQDILASNLEDLRRMAGIVADMLFLSHADRGKEARRSQVASIAQLAGEVIEFHEASLQEARLSISIVGDATAEADAPLLRRAISNLLGNATRYAIPESTVSVEISSRGLIPGQAMNQCGVISIDVVNDGLAIDSKHISRIFDRFYRSDSSRTRADMNHGLGLAIVAAIARMHGGATYAKSENGRTRVGFTLSNIRSDDETKDGKLG